MNIIVISGNLTAEPTTTQTPSGKTVLKFSIANNDESKKDESGNYQDVVSFFECEFWPKNVQHWIQKLTKGTGVVIEGQLKQQRWQNDDGQNRSKIVCRVNKFPLNLEGKKEISRVQQTQEDNTMDDFEDGIPF